MDTETAKSVGGLIDLFGQRDGSIILERLTRYVTIFRNTNGSTFPEVTIIAVINSILWYIEMYNPTKQQDDPVMNAGNLAYNRIIRIYYIRTIFMNQDEKTGVGLFNIIAECLSNNDNSTEISVAIDRFITSTGLRPSLVLIQDAKEAYRVAEGIARGRGPQSYGQGPTATLGSHLGRGPIPSSDPSQHTFRNVDNPLRERILEIEKETRGVILDLNNPATQIAVFNRLNETGPIYSLQEVMDEIDRLLTDRGGLPPPVTFSRGIFTPNQQGLRDKAINLGWEYGMGIRDSPYFFHKPGGAADPAPIEEGGGNKRIKSKKNSKRRYKKSKKRSNRRRRRYSYKK